MPGPPPLESLWAPCHVVWGLLSPCCVFTFVLVCGQGLPCQRAGPLPSGWPKPPLCHRSWSRLSNQGLAGATHRPAVLDPRSFAAPHVQGKFCFFLALALSPTHPPQHSDEPLPAPPGQVSPWSRVLRALHGVGRAKGQRRPPEMNWGPALPTSSFLAPARAPACHGLVVPSPCGQHKVYICFVPLPVSVHSV
ncbi:hypothetical protein mRhiFer1_009493 [Rhinolophus ferrumequinum]|uniref:Uncharacterized protein n=1 Tax=Rhinolophus ferrumequinum TaxID=59479 RepID=A0A7J7REW7_RHIFE|nr:hypothetical protein mRhiFer1_009493 [Rhinolophus ferrumequinum]